MGGNHFYSNAEAYAYEILQQKLIKEAQRTAQQTAQQTVMELSALRTLFNQGQFIFCIPFGAGFGQNPPLPPPCSPFNVCPIDPNFGAPDAYYYSLPPPQPPPPSQSSLSPQNSGPHPPPPHLLQPHNNNNSNNNNNNNNNSNNNNNNINNNNNNNNSGGNSKLSVIQMNLKNQPKIMPPRLGSDECNLGKEGIDVTIDMREYIPAEIQVNVEERSVEIKACHVNETSSKTFARRYDLPACIILDSVRCLLTHDGFLILSASWMKME